MKKTPKKLHRILSVVLMLFLLLPVFAPAPANAKTDSREMTVHFLDVGQGLSIFVQSDGKNLIYDGGDKDSSRFVVSYLKDQGVKTIDYMISSHYDSDHLSGLIGCLNAFKVKHVISSDYVHDSKTYRSFVKAVKKEGLSMEHPKVGKKFRFGSGSFQILAPSSINDNNSNSNSVVIKLINGENSFLFTGDAEVSSEEAMEASGLDLSCDVLVPSHHGSATATSWDFLQETVPEYAVISCGKDNQYGHPTEETMEKLESMDIEVFRTDIQGTITASSDGEELTWDQNPCNDYSPGDEEDTGAQPQPSAAPEAKETPTPPPAQEVSESVWISETGSKYHRIPNCGRMNPANATQLSRSEAEAQGYEPCKKCY